MISGTRMTPSPVSRRSSACGSRGRCSGRRNGAASWRRTATALPRTSPRRCTGARCCGSAGRVVDRCVRRVPAQRFSRLPVRRRGDRRTARCSPSTGRRSAARRPRHVFEIQLPVSRPRARRRAREERPVRRRLDPCQLHDQRAARRRRRSSRARPSGSARRSAPPAREEHRREQRDRRRGRQEVLEALHRPELEERDRDDDPGEQQLLAPAALGPEHDQPSTAAATTR